MWLYYFSSLYLSPNTRIYVAQASLEYATLLPLFDTKQSMNSLSTSANKYPGSKHKTALCYLTQEVFIQKHFLHDLGSTISRSDVFYCKYAFTFYSFSPLLCVYGVFVCVHMTLFSVILPSFLFQTVSTCNFILFYFKRFIYLFCI